MNRNEVPIHQSPTRRGRYICATSSYICLVEKGNSVVVIDSSCYEVWKSNFCCCENLILRSQDNYIPFLNLHDGASALCGIASSCAKTYKSPFYFLLDACSGAEGGARCHEHPILSMFGPGPCYPGLPSVRVNKLILYVVHVFLHLWVTSGSHRQERGKLPKGEEAEMSAEILLYSWLIKLHQNVIFVPDNTPTFTFTVN